MNTEERQLAEMLHRVTPEPPRRVTVEDVAFRLANEAGRARGGHPGAARAARPRPGHGGRGWAPVLAAASVVVVAGASAGIATAMASHHSRQLAGGRDAALVGLGVDPGDLGAVAAVDVAPGRPGRRSRSPAGCGAPS